jgi:hypothetical protein
MSRRLVRAVLHFLLASALLALAAATPAYAMRCQMAGGIVVSRCCCPPGASDKDANQETRSLTRDPCCKLESLEAAAPPSDRPAAGPRLEPPLTASIHVPARTEAPEQTALGPITYGRAPPPGPSLLLIKRSFLI